ncbi:hypothetical protein [Marinobacter sp.]|uniref:hypothetical protein n=1 Tax=Marinobacter sp. TaxID=50741 RepID=UPI003F984644
MQIAFTAFAIENAGSPDHIVKGALLQLDGATAGKSPVPVHLIPQKRWFIVRFEKFVDTAGVAAGKLKGIKAGDWRLPVCFDSPIQRRIKLAFRLLSKETRETGVLGIWLSATSWALNSGGIEGVFGTGELRLRCS